MLLTIRRATERDRSAVVEIRRACVSSLAPDPYSSLLVKRWLDPRNLEGTLQRLEAGELWAAELDGEVCGFSCGVPGEVESLFVHPRRQRQGVGRHLLRRAEEPSVAWRRPVVRVLSTVNAVPFYAAHGYREVTDRSVCLPTGVRVRAREMRKSLRASQRAAAPAPLFPRN